MVHISNNCMVIFRGGISSFGQPPQIEYFEWATEDGDVIVDENSNVITFEAQP